jgi:hypothetical protein
MAQPVYVVPEVWNNSEWQVGTRHPKQMSLEHKSLLVEVKKYSTGIGVRPLLFCCRRWRCFAIWRAPTSREKEVPAQAQAALLVLLRFGIRSGCQKTI